LKLPAIAALVTLLSSVTLSALTPDVLTAVGAIPAHIAGRFRDPRGFGQSSSGQYFVFDRRAHTVYGVDERMESLWTIVEIGGEPGRIIDPNGFAVAADGSFVVADAPRGQSRLQVFTVAGSPIGLFFLPEQSRARLVLEEGIVGGIGSIAYTGTSVLVSQPEHGALFTEYSRTGVPIRSVGRLRSTGQEHDPEVHLALNSGIPLADPRGGFYFIFQAGVPVLRKYDERGELMFERTMQGREIDGLIANLTTVWPRRSGELPVVKPSVRAAALDPAGHIWVSFAVPFTYVYDQDGDKIRTVQLLRDRIFVPTSLVFGMHGRLLATPGLVAFNPSGSLVVSQRGPWSTATFGFVRQTMAAP
jgi:hypothetical protein